jgi:hypothetical protein
MSILALWPTYGAKKNDDPKKLLMSQPTQQIQKYVVKYDNKMAPVSPLDRILTQNDTEVSCVMYDFYGNLLTEENQNDFYQKVVANAKACNYLTTDHLITCIKAGETTLLYVSLDNSVRSNKAGHPLYLRLEAICDAVVKIIKDLPNIIVFFSESCRPSFMIDSNGEKSHITNWLTMRTQISQRCGLDFLTEKRNNEDPSDMSFGVSVFSRSANINTYFCKNILTEGFGSVAVGVELTDGEIYWGIHFPLDFKNKGADNLGAKTMVNLQDLMDEYDGSVCAFGDFNTIPGYIEDAILSSIRPEYRLIHNRDTFFGGYYDTIPEDESWLPLVNGTFI